MHALKNLRTVCIKCSKGSATYPEGYMDMSNLFWIYRQHYLEKFKNKSMKGNNDMR